MNNQSSIWRNNLNGDPNSGSSWTRAGATSDTLSFNPQPMYELAIDHEGGDIGSPGFAPGTGEELPGDFSGDGDVDAADYVIWRKTGGTPAGLAAWRANYGRVAAGARDGGLAVVPEPGAAMLFALGSAMACAMRPKRRNH